MDFIIPADLGVSCTRVGHDYFGAPVFKVTAVIFHKLTTSIFGSDKRLKNKLRNRKAQGNYETIVQAGEIGLFF